MSRKRRLRPAPLLLLLLSLAGPLAAATSESRLAKAPEPQLSVNGLLSEAWALVNRIWGKSGSSIDPFGKAGSEIDPFGKVGSSTGAFGKAGAMTDPFGKAGSGIDPFGNPGPNTAQPGSGSSSVESLPPGM